MKPGYLTTEFYVTVLTNLLAVISVIFHSHYNIDIPKVAAASATIANIVYTLSRSFVKYGFVKTLENTVGNTTAPVTSNNKPVTGAVDPEAFGA